MHAVSIEFAFTFPCICPQTRYEFYSRSLTLW